MSTDEKIIEPDSNSEGIWSFLWKPLIGIFFIIFSYDFHMIILFHVMACIY